MISNSSLNHKAYQSINFCSVSLLFTFHYFVFWRKTLSRLIDIAIQCSYITFMKTLRFEWDSEKARINIEKHAGVSFKEAESVFYDERAIEFYDEEHSETEKRFLMLGLSVKLRLLLVCHCVRESDSIIRIISARKATKKEAKHYWR